MTIVSKKPIAAAFAVIALSAGSVTFAQQSAIPENITVVGTAPGDLSELPKGPDIEGFISARDSERVQITSEDGTSTVIQISEATEIKAKGGFLGLASAELAGESLLNGLPVSVETVEWNGGLVASRIDLKDKDLRTATMIRAGTAQGFAEQTAATEALRGRVGDIDQYNVRSTTNVYFDTGKWALTPEGEAALCAAADQAKATDNALLLVVGYTDAQGTDDNNQTLSERRAGRVVNHLQQKCGWAPYRMLTPTGMAEADPQADNTTPAGMAQNRRVAVNILVSKAVEGL